MSIKLYQFAVLAFSSVAVIAGSNAAAQGDSSVETRYAVSVIDDATFYHDQSVPISNTLNRVLLEPSFSAHLQHRYTLSSSIIGVTKTRDDNATQLLVREAYAGLSAGDFDFTAGRKLLRWGTGYAFTAAGVLDPPRIPTDPSDRLNLNEGRDMVKADWVHGPHAVTFAWSSAELARKGTKVLDTTAVRYNVLVYGFDTSLIAGNDRGGDSFGGLTFTRVVGQAWEVHGEGMWREHPAVLLGGKYTMRSGWTFIGEFYTPPNIAAYRSASLSPLAGRQHYALINAAKTRLRELPGWKEWDVSGSMVSNLDDHSYAGVFDVSRWFGNHFSAYIHAELPAGKKHSEYGAAPYAAATSVGIRFHL